MVLQLAVADGQFRGKLLELRAVALPGFQQAYVMQGGTQARAQRAQQRQRPGMAVIGRPARPHHGGADSGQALRHLGTAEHPVLEADIAGLRAHALHPRGAGGKLLLREAQMQPARLLQRGIESGSRRQRSGERRPLSRRSTRPPLIMRRAEPLGLYPDQAEIAPAGAVRDVALVQQQRIQPLLGQAAGDGDADQPATNDDGIVPARGRGGILRFKHHGRELGPGASPDTNS